MAQKTMTTVRDEVLTLVNEVERLIPRELLPDLPPGEHTSGMPEWRSFERQIWEIGEQIRQLILTKKELRGDEELQNSFCRIACSRNAKNGRQPFFGLLGYTISVRLAPQLAEQLDDYRVAGQAIDALLKMRAEGFASEINPLLSAEKAWIRKKAKTYCERYPETLTKA